MLGNRRLLRWSLGALALALAIAAAVPAEAQRFRTGNFFQDLFGGGGAGQRPYPTQPEGAQPQADYSRAPAPKKPDPTIVPTTSIVVMGDAMADWLAYGLEDAFSDSPEIAIVRNGKRNSPRIDMDIPVV